MDEFMNIETRTNEESCKELIGSKICKTLDLGANGNLYGGRILEWLDDAGGIFAVKQILGPVVTLKFSEVLFRVPVHERDILDFYGIVKEVGNTSITIDLDVINALTQVKVCTCEIIFIHVDENGNKVAISEDRKAIINKNCGFN
jgi:acyl-CoA thioesterase YciA